jgi:hypothetical protein
VSITCSNASRVHVGASLTKRISVPRGLGKRYEVVGMSQPSSSPPELTTSTSPRLQLLQLPLGHRAASIAATTNANMAEASQNPLVSTARASDNSSTVQLHPLVLLTISDCITRHTLRQQTGPVVGAIIGQQNGQEITMEVAFQAKLKANDAGDVVLDAEWFNKRLEDCTYRCGIISPHVVCFGSMLTL